jgi:hypothetical protein
MHKHFFEISNLNFSKMIIDIQNINGVSNVKFEESNKDDNNIL